jgi:glycerol-3-phosphate acyltransferase PlsY
VWFVVARVLHKASLASLLCAVVFPIAVWAFGYALWEVAATAAIAVFVIARHRANIRRLLHRQELGLGRT